MSKNNKDANKPSLKSEARLMVNDNHGTESLCSNIDAIQEQVATVTNAKTSITELELHADHNQDSPNDAHLEPQSTSNKPNHEVIADANQAPITAEPTTAAKESTETKTDTQIDIEDAEQVEELGSILPTPEAEVKAGASNNTKASATSTAANTDTGTDAVVDADTGTVADTGADAKNVDPAKEVAKAATKGKDPKQLNNHKKHDKKGSFSKKEGQAVLGSQDEVGAGVKGGRGKWFRLRNVVGALSLLALVGLGSIYVLMHLCAPDLSRFYDRSHSLYDKSGNIIYSSMNKDGYHRILTTQAQVDPLYIKMLIASEDERFYSHPGVDVISIGRALWSNITSGSIVSGASTIAMQVCRMLEPKERSIWSKAKEALGALYLTHYYGRDQILSLYLTLAPFGGNIEGVNAASYIYFNHSPKNLTPAEAALLVALPRSPEVIRPDRHPKSARYYRNEVLKKAVTDKIIKQDILAFATKEPIPNVRHALPQDAYYLGQSIFTSKLITPEIKALRELTARIIGKQVITSEQDTQSSHSAKDNQDQSPTLDKAANENNSQELANAKGNTLGQDLTASEQGAQLVEHNQEQKETINQVIEVQLSGASIKIDQYEAFNKAALQDGLNQFGNVDSSKLGQGHGNSQGQSQSLGHGQSLGSHSTEFERKLKMLNSLGPLPRELYTTIDPKVQELLINAVEEYRHSFLGEDKQDSLSIVVVDNDTFEVLGYVGALGTDISYVDSALALRSPGSALKPFAYALAFDQGLLHPNSILLDKGQIYDGYQPRNYDRQFYGELTAAKALQASLNLPAVEVMRAIGPDNFINMINNTKNDIDLYDHSQELNTYVHGSLVLPKQSKPSLSLVLGGCGISLFDLTQLYASLAHDGSSAPLRVLSAKRPSSAMVRKHNYKYHFDAENKKEKTSVRAVGNKPERSYQSLKENHIHYQTMVRPAAARATYNILQGTPAPFGFGNNYFSLGPKVSYKTGTSYKNRDAWALGSSNNITVGVWTGRNDGSPSYQRTGFNHAAPILFKVITKLTSNDMRKKRIEDDVLLHARPPIALSKIQVKQLGLVTKKEDGYQSYNANLTSDTKDNQVHKFGRKSTIEPLAIAFPTDNSRLSLGSSSEVLIKFSGGKAPYYVLINDELNDNLESFKPTHDGFYQITIIDSLGNSVSSQVYVQGLDQ